MKVGFRKIFASSVGSFLELYDFFLYAFLAPSLSKIFFPLNDPSALMYTYLIFAMTYLARPLGGLFFGYFVDKFSRKKVLVIAIGIMGISTTLIGLIPTFNRIGWWAPTILLILRFIQGFSVGGDYIESLVYLIEHGEKGGRGKLGCYINMAASLGILVAPLIVYLSKIIFPGNLWWSIGWRTPFYFGFLAAISGIYIRLKLGESPQFAKLLKENKLSQNPIKEFFSNAKVLLLKCFVFSTYIGVSLYVVLIFLNTWYIHFEHMPLETALLISIVTLICNIFGTYIGGVSSDYFGRKKILYFTSISIIILTIPIFLLIEKLLIPQGYLFWIIVVQSLLLLIHGMIAGVLPATLSELLPARIRGSGFAFSYNLALGIFGGTAPIFCLWMLKKNNSLIGPAAYVTITALFALAITFTLKETAKSELQA